MSVKKALDTFSKRVKQQARANLTRNKMNASKGLYESTKYDLTVSPNSFILSFDLKNYWQFQDSGVSGTERKFNTPFSYKTKKPPAQIFEKWAKLKGIKPRNKQGKFTTYKSFGFAVATAIFKRGIKPTKFFTKPFENEFKKLPEEVVEAFALELDDLLTFTTS
jgi:hypothetical protein